MIVILLPTRQRINGLLNTLNSIKETVTGHIEKKLKVFLKFDSNDIETQEMWADHISGYSDWVRTYEWPRGRGYLDLFTYNNTLAFLASDLPVSWFLIMNDDAHFTITGWEDTLLSMNEKKPIIALDLENLFPAVNIHAYKAMGTITKANHADTYLKMVGEQAGCFRSVNLGIVHEAHKFEDIVRKEGQASYGQEWEIQKKHIDEDVKRILEYKVEQ